VQRAQAKVKLVPTLNACYDYACGVCNKVYPFYDQALDCVLEHRVARLNSRTHKYSRNWESKRW